MPAVLSGNSLDNCGMDLDIRKPMFLLLPEVSMAHNIAGAPWHVDGLGDPPVNVALLYLTARQS